MHFVNAQYYQYSRSIFLLAAFGGAYDATALRAVAAPKGSWTAGRQRRETRCRKSIVPDAGDVFR
jgi:hypothetical protein